MELTIVLIILQVSTGMSSASVERSLVVLDPIPVHLMQKRRNTRTVVTTHKMGTEALRSMNSGMCSGGLAVRRPCLKVPCVPSGSLYQRTNLRYFCFVCETSNSFGRLTLTSISSVTMQVLQDNLEWEDVQWSQTGVWVAGKEYPLARVHFLSAN